MARKRKTNGKATREQATRNKRVHIIDPAQWINFRKRKLNESLRFAAAAKSYRTTLGLTQGEMGHYYRVTGSTVARWESGFYFGWTDEGLTSYSRDCDRVAGTGMER